MTLDAAVKRIESFVGTRYDEKVVAALVAACNEGQIQPGRVKLNMKPPTITPLPDVKPTAEPVNA